jgi:hypothetical protein
MEAGTGACRISMCGPGGIRPLGRPSHRKEDSIKMGFQGVEWGGIYWINLLFLV